MCRSSRDSGRAARFCEIHRLCLSRFFTTRVEENAAFCASQTDFGGISAARKRRLLSDAETAQSQGAQRCHFSGDFGEFEPSGYRRCLVFSVALGTRSTLYRATTRSLSQLATSAETSSHPASAARTCPVPSRHISVLSTDPRRSYALTAKGDGMR